MWPVFDMRSLFVNQDSQLKFRRFKLRFWVCKLRILAFTILRIGASPRAFGLVTRWRIVFQGYDGSIALSAVLAPQRTR